MKTITNCLAKATTKILIAVALLFPQMVEAKAIPDLQKTTELANSGDNNAQSDLIDYSYNTAKDYNEAIKWCELLIKNPNASNNNKGYAYLILGLCADSGKGMRKSDLSSFLYWQEGADYDSRCALYTANTMLNRQDTVNALKYYEKAAELRNADAAYFLGELYETGYAITPNMANALTLRKGLIDKSKAIKYYEGFLNYSLNNEHKIESQRPKVYYKLARWYYSGEDKIEKSYTRAFNYFNQAIEWNQKCDKHNTLSAEEEGDALWHLSVCYRLGRGVDKDELLARRYVKLAAEKGNEKAIAILNE